MKGIIGCLWLIFSPCRLEWASQVAQRVKNLPAVQETQEMWVWSLGWEDPLEEGMATHSSILVWRIHMDRGAWRAIQSTGSQRVRHNWATKHLLSATRAKPVQQRGHSTAKNLKNKLKQVFFKDIVNIDNIFVRWWIAFIIHWSEVGLNGPSLGNTLVMVNFMCQPDWAKGMPGKTYLVVCLCGYFQKRLPFELAD